MTHHQYFEHLYNHLSSFSNESWNIFLTVIEQFTILANLNLDPIAPYLKRFYCPVKRGKTPRDPVCMLRSLILMTLFKISSITTWVEKTHLPIFAILAGFNPGDTPGVGTYYDFMKRIINGPYRKPCNCTVKNSTIIVSKHKRNLKKEKDAPTSPSQPLSEQLVDKLRTLTNQPRPDDFIKFTEDALLLLGIMPSIEGLFITTANGVVISGDGSILPSASSSTGTPSCTCKKDGLSHCDHPRYYTTHTAQWCYDAHKKAFLFGDRYYQICLAQNGHDFPLLTIMPGGNESDYTLSIQAIERLLKLISEHHLNLKINAFCGDGHHDSNAHYLYLKEKDITPIIPLSENSKNNTFHQLPDNPNTLLDSDGTPLCPAGAKMRHHQYNTKRHIHVFCCPIKRNTHLNGQSTYVAHIDECPQHQDCCPDSTLGPLVYVHADNDPRLYPPIPRNSKQFKTLMNLRTANERLNSLTDSYHINRSCRNVFYGLIRLTLITIAQHAVIRYHDMLKRSSAIVLCSDILDKLHLKLPPHTTGK